MVTPAYHAGQRTKEGKRANGDSAHRTQRNETEQGEIRNGRSLFSVAIAIVDTYERADEGEDFAEGNEDGGVDGADGRESESGGEQCAPEDAHCDCRKELETLVYINCEGFTDKTYSLWRNHFGVWLDA